MTTKIKIIKIPIETYNRIKGIKINMENDIQKIAGKRIPLTFGKVLKVMTSPEFNENYIQVDIKKLFYLAKKKKGERY